MILRFVIASSLMFMLVACDDNGEAPPNNVVVSKKIIDNAKKVSKKVEAQVQKVTKTIEKPASENVKSEQPNATITAKIPVKPSLKEKNKPELNTPPSPPAEAQTPAAVVTDVSDQAGEQSESQQQPKEKPKAENMDEILASEATITSDLMETLEDTHPLYSGKNRIDPFEPLFKEKEIVEKPAVLKLKVKKKPKFITPLQKLDLSQLKLSAVFHLGDDSKALVEEATGKGYIVRKGTLIGKNEGKVIDILKDKIVIEEEIEHIIGEVKFRKTELKLQKASGENENAL